MNKKSKKIKPESPLQHIAKVEKKTNAILSTSPLPDDASAENEVSAEKSYIMDAPNAQQEAWYRKIFWIIASIALVLMAIMSFSYGISGDEQDMAEYGKAALRFYTSFGADVSAFNMELDRDGVFKYYGAWFDVLAAIFNKILPFWEYNTRHLLNAIVGWWAMVLIAFTAQLFMGWRSAIIAFILVFFSPIFFGHAMNNPKDIPFAMGMMMGTYYILKLITELPFPKKSTVFLACLGIGLAIGSRIGGLLLFGYLGLFFGLSWLINYQKISFLTYVKYGLILGIGGFALGILFFPYGLQSPIAHTIETFQHVAKFPIAIKETFQGELFLSKNLPTYYLPMSILISTPLIIIAGFLLSVLMLPQMKKRMPWMFPIFLLFASVFPIVYIMATDANVYGSWRHVLFFYPPCIAFIGMGIETLLRIVQKNKFMPKVIYAFLAVLVLSNSYWYVKAHPNQYVYYNALVGGTKGAVGYYELDYYYNSIRATTDWFRKNILDNLPKGEKVILATNAQKQVQFYFKDDERVDIVYTNYYNKSMKDWDYGIFASKGVIPKHMREGAFPHVGKAGILYINELEEGALSAVVKRMSKGDFEAYEALVARDAELAKAKIMPYLQEIDSTDASTINYWANAEFLLGNYEQAQQIANRALEKHPMHTGALGVIAQIHVNQKNYIEAVKYLRLLLNEDVNMSWAHYYMALSLNEISPNCEQGMLAISHIDTCISLNSSFIDAYKAGEQISAKCNFEQKRQQYQRQLQKVQ